MKKISIIGDIVCDKEMLKYKSKFNDMLSPLKEYFKSTDYLVCNLETVISSSNYTDSVFSFCNPKELLDTLKYIGVDAVSLANNHILDRGIKGIKDTTYYLDKYKIKYFGIKDKVLNINIDNNKIAILGYTDSTNYHINKYKVTNEVNILKDVNILSGKKHILSSNTRIIIKNILHRKIRPIVDDKVNNDTYYLDRISNIVNKLKNQNRYIIMYPHIGGQYNIIPGRYTNSVVKYFNDIGCDSILITHPHIIQDTKSLENTLSIGGVIISPKSKFVLWDTLPQYSIVVNYYFDKNKLIKITISFLICVKDKKTYLKVYPVYNFYNSLNEKNKAKYKKEFEKILNRVFDGKLDIKDEYIIWG